MDDLQKQVVIGTVLGGSSLTKQSGGKNYYLSMRSKDDIWLKYKIAELVDYFNSSELSKQNNTYRCNSICSKEFTRLHDRLYRDGVRCVSEDILDKIRDIGIAIWWLEGGGWAGRNRKNAYINTTMLGQDGTKLVRKYFNDIYQIPCNINNNKSRRRVLFTVTGTLKLWATIEHRFPPFYLDRLSGT